VLIGGGDSVVGDIWISCTDCLGGEAVQQIYGGVEPFYPVMSWNIILKEQRVHHIINGVKNALNFTVLRRSVWIIHPQNHPISGEECTRGGIVELTAIDTLDDFDDATKLCGDVGNFFDKVEKVSDLTRKGKST
jgi:hypothetical protein